MYTFRFDGEGEKGQLLQSQLFWIFFSCSVVNSLSRIFHALQFAVFADIT
jgi:hypothetical protein